MAHADLDLSDPLLLLLREVLAGHLVTTCGTDLKSLGPAKNHLICETQAFRQTSWAPPA
ncbi:MAG: hypothetical protein ACI85K_001586 [Hyphomicrobiaceae bacterium]|jgi:hypothetical protein